MANRPPAGSGRWEAQRQLASPASGAGSTPARASWRDRLIGCVPTGLPGDWHPAGTRTAHTESRKYGADGRIRTGDLLITNQIFRLFC